MRGIHHGRRTLRHRISGATLRGIGAGIHTLDGRPAADATRPGNGSVPSHRRPSDRPSARELADHDRARAFRVVLLLVRQCGREYAVLDPGLVGHAGPDWPCPRTPLL